MSVISDIADLTASVANLTKTQQLVLTALLAMPSSANLPAMTPAQLEALKAEQTRLMALIQAQLAKLGGPA